MVKFARLLCCLWIFAFLGQGFAVSAQSWSQHSLLPIQTEHHQAHAQQHAESETALSKPHCAHHGPQMDKMAQAKAETQSDSKPKCCSGGYCSMNCHHKNGDAPCSFGCDPVQISSVMIISEISQCLLLTAVSEPPVHFQHWLESPTLARQTPPPKFS